MGLYYHKLTNGRSEESRKTVKELERRERRMNAKVVKSVVVAAMTCALAIAKAADEAKSKA